jgi:hypothetical protein
MLGGSCSPCCDACVNYSIFAEAETLEASIEYEYSDGIGGEITSLTDSSQLVDSNSQTFSNSFFQTHTLSRTSVEEFLVTWESQPFTVNGREMRLTCQVNILPVGIGTQTQALVPENPALWTRRSSLEFLCVRGRHPAAFLPENLSPTTGLPLDSYSGLGHIGIFEQPCGLQPSNVIQRGFGSSAIALGPWSHFRALPHTGGFEPAFTGVWSYGHNRDGGNIYGGTRPGQGFTTSARQNLQIEGILAADCQPTLQTPFDTIPIIRGFIGNSPVSSPVTQISYNGSNSGIFVDEEGIYGVPMEQYARSGFMLFSEKIVVHSLVADFGQFTQNMLMTVLPAVPNAVWSNNEGFNVSNMFLRQNNSDPFDRFTFTQTPCYGLREFS